MIPIAKVYNIFTLAQASLGFNFFMAKTEDDKDTDFATFTFITETESDRWETPIINTDNLLPPKDNNKTFKVKNLATISLNFFSEQDLGYEVARLNAGNCLEFFRFAKENEVDFQDVVVKVLNSEVQDRSIYLDANWEYKFGFDIQLEYCEDKVVTVESIKSTEATGSPESAIGPLPDQDLVIAKP